MISRTIDYLHRLLDLQAEEQIIPRKLESINPTLVIPLEYFWSAAGPTVRDTVIVDHSLAGVETIIVPRSEAAEDTVLLDWVWAQNAASQNYAVDLRLRDVDGGAVTTIFHVVITGAFTGIVTRGEFSTLDGPRLFPNQFTLPRHVRANEELSVLAADGGAAATGNSITTRLVRFPKDGPIPRLAY